MCVNAGSTKGVKRFNRTSEKKKNLTIITGIKSLYKIGR